jgi:SAM-dependent MidA family methyltransferase
MSESSLLLTRLEEMQDRHGGWIPWREFMRFALLDPTHGYYANRVKGIGAGGDFTTAPVVSPLLGRALVRWFLELPGREKELSGFVPWIEVGAGDGSLAANWIREYRRRLPWWQRLPGRGPIYWIVEISPQLREVQRKRLGRFPVRWFGSVAEALCAAGGRAVIFSNELVDAMPCSAWELTPAGWQERGLVIQAGRIREVTRPGTLPDSSIWTAAEWTVGQRAETHEIWREWLASWRDGVEKVHLLTIDYGAPAADLLWRRPAGTLRAYWRHQRLEGAQLYARVGRQDLTADVNLTDLCRWAEAAGGSTVFSRTMADFLATHRPAMLHPLENLAAADRRLLDPDDAGSAFFVLEQAFSRGKRGFHGR